MKLSISNIAWDQEDDVEIFEEMQNLGYKGLEIAPTKIFPVEPYNNIKVACEWKNRVCNQYGFGISSIQSIWFGRKENLFSSIDEYNYLLDYTKKIIEFAGALECHNIVFGCPSNRRIDNNYEQNYHNAKEFFYQLSDCLEKNNTIIAIEPVPEIYNTNFLNTTKETVQFVSDLDMKNVRVNLDLGTMIFNNEQAEIIGEASAYINHVHISEPNLLPVNDRKIHKDVIKLLVQSGFEGYLSIEMKKKDITTTKSVMRYVRNLI